MTSAYMVKLGFTIRKITVGAQKIDTLALEIYNKTRAIFSI